MLRRRSTAGVLTEMGLKISTA